MSAGLSTAGEGGGEGRGGEGPARVTNEPSVPSCTSYRKQLRERGNRCVKRAIYYNVTTTVTTTTTMLKWTVVTKPETFRKRIVVSSLYLLNTTHCESLVECGQS